VFASLIVLLSRTLPSFSPARKSTRARKNVPFKRGPRIDFLTLAATGLILASKPRLAAIRARPRTAGIRYLIRLIE